MINDQITIIGGGSSVSGFDLHKLDDYFTFGLNFVCHFYNPTALIWVDRDFYPTHHQYIDNKDCVKITKTINKNVPTNTIKLPDSKEYFGIDGLQKGLYTSFMVGLFSLSLGIALKFKEIYLLGYDCKFVNNKSHFHDIEHRGTKSEKPYNDSILKFDVYRNSESKIYNVSLESAINVFPKISYDEFLSRLNCKVNQKDAREWLKNQVSCFGIS